MKAKKTFLSLLLVYSMLLSMFMPAFAVDSDVPVLEIVPDKTIIDAGTGTADVIYTISLKPNGNKVAAFEFNLTAPEGMTLATNKLKNSEANKGGDGYWIAANALKYDEDEETGVFDTFTYTPATGYFGASGGIEGRTLDAETVIMTIKATISDISKIATYTLGVTNFNAFGVGAVNQNAEAPVVTDVEVKADTHEHTFSTEWSKDGTYHWHAASCEHTAEVADKAEHVYDKEVVAEDYKIEDASCKLGAKYFKSCICGAKPATETADNVFYTQTLATHNYGELIPAVEEKHTQSELVASVDAHYECSVCHKLFVLEGETYVEKELNELTGETPAHNYENENGYKGEDGHADTCVCGAKDTVVAHTPGDAATETSDQICTVCGYVITPKLDHVHTNNLTHVAADPKSCTKNGNIEYWTCSCGKWFSDENATTEITDKNSVVIPAGHDFTKEEVKDAALKTAGDCGQEAVYFKSCASCGLVDTDVNNTFLGEKDAENHADYGTYLDQAAEPDHKNQVNGYTGDQRCNSCKQIVEAGEAIPVNPHTQAEGWEFDTENHWKVCSVEGCGYVFDNTVASHIESEWKLSGSKHYKECTVCGFDTYAEEEHMDEDKNGLCDKCQTVVAYIVTFNENGGSEVEDQYVPVGEMAMEPTAPTKEGHTFITWLLNGVEYVFRTVVTGNIELIAQWEENQPEVPATTSVTVTKEWDVHETFDLVNLPESVEVYLLANGQEVTDSRRTLDASNQWTYTWTELPVATEDGTTIVYTVDEIEVPEGYEKSITDAEVPAGIGFVITNTFIESEEPEEPETVTVSGTKTWIGDEENYEVVRPASIIVNLLANGEVIDEAEVTARTQWIFYFDELPKYDEAGSEVEYSVEEEAVEGYTATYDGYNITNTLIEEEPEVPETTSVTVVKEWDAPEGTVLPESVEVYLLSNGQEVTDSRTVLDEGNEWTYTWTELPVTEENGTPIVYTVDEVEVEGYEKAIGEAIETDTGIEIAITNTKNEDNEGGNQGGSSTPSTPSNPTPSTPVTPPTLNKEDHIAFMQGYTDGTFGPTKNMTRGEVATMFARLLTEKMDADKTYTNTFTDVPADMWCYNYIGYMQQFGIITGYPDGSFRPEAPITRSEFAAIACRFEELTEGTKTFSDVPETHWAAKYISYAAERGWVTGYTDGTFKPDANITREEVVAVTCRLLERNADADYINTNYEDLTKTYSDVKKEDWSFLYIMEASNGHDYTKNDGVETWVDLH